MALRTSEPGLAPTILLATERGHRAGLAQQIGAPHQRSSWSSAHADLIVRVAHRVGAQHQAGEVERPLVQVGDVRAVDVAELALEALVDDLVLLRRA